MIRNSLKSIESDPFVFYLYADEGLIAESQQAITLNADTSVSATAAPQITTQYGPRPNSQFTTATLFVKTKNSASGNTIAYYHHDHLGTPIQATDRSGIVVWSAQYNAFGQASITTPTATEDKPVIASGLRFPGQVEDAETGLYYNWHRYYDPELGRYVTGDPIGLVGGMNLYAYVKGNPVSIIDPTGFKKAGCEFFPYSDSVEWKPAQGNWDDTHDWYTEAVQVFDCRLVREPALPSPEPAPDEPGGIKRPRDPGDFSEWTLKCGYFWHWKSYMRQKYEAWASGMQVCYDGCGNIISKDGGAVRKVGSEWRKLEGTDDEGWEPVTEYP